MTVVLWASAFVGIRSASVAIAAGPLALARLAIGAVALGAVVLARREALPPRRALPGIALCGVIWFSLYNVALNEGERHVGAGTAAMLVNVGPLVTVLLAGWLLGEGFPRGLVAGCAIAFAGVALIGVGVGGGLTLETGTAFCLLAALAYGVGMAIQKPLLRSAGALQVTWLGCLAGVVACLPFAPALVREASAADAEALAWTAYLGVFPTAIAFTTWAYALSHTSASTLSALTFLVPPLAVAMAWAMLGEVPPALAIAGGALCLAGVALTRRRPGTDQRE